MEEQFKGSLGEIKIVSETNDKLFSELNSIDCSSKVEDRQGLKYLSWAWAWTEFKKRCPDAVYRIVMFDGKPYDYDTNLGYMVMTEITANGQTLPMWLPVMDSTNNAMRDCQYDYKVKNKNYQYATFNKDKGYAVDKYGKRQDEYVTKTVAKASMFDVNKTIMRCLTKNIAMFGLGLYIYAGEDLPEIDYKSEINQILETKELDDKRRGWLQGLLLLEDTTIAQSWNEHRSKFFALPDKSK